MARPPRYEREAFARRLQAALDAAGKSRERLANDLGLHVNTVGAWLRSQRDCPVGWIPVMAATLGMDVQDLVQDPTRSAASDATPLINQDLAQLVVTTLERPLTTPDLMGLLAEARSRLPPT